MRERKPELENVISLSRWTLRKSYITGKGSLLPLLGSPTWSWRQAGLQDPEWTKLTNRHCRRSADSRAPMRTAGCDDCDASTSSGTTVGTIAVLDRLYKIKRIQKKKKEKKKKKTRWSKHYKHAIVNNNTDSSCIHTSSGTARTLLNPLRKTTKTRLAPHRKADVAQSKAVSPAPRTITLPCSDGRADLHLHIPDRDTCLFVLFF